MLVAARDGAWAKSGYTARDYVQDGLVAMWDGIENAGWGVHDSAATVWKDLSGNGWDFSLNPNKNRVSFGDSYINMKNIGVNGVCAAYTPKGIIGNGYSCLEIVYEPYNRAMDIFNPGGPYYENSDFGFYASLTYIQFGTQNGEDRWRYAFDSENNKPYYAACNIDKNNGNIHHGFVNGVPVNRTDSLASSSYVRGTHSSIGGRYTNGFVNDYGASGKIFALRLSNRFLTDAEIAANYAIDKARFGLT